MIDKKLEKIIQKHFQKEQIKFIPGKTRIPLAAPAYSHEEVISALESLLSTWVTMGKKVNQFEKKFCDYIGTRYGIMVNSGSSANLLALSVLSNPIMENPIKNNSSIITPAITWATTVSPIVNVGCKPLFVDVDLDTFCVNIDAVRESINQEVSCILPVHLLGNPCDMKQIMEIANEKNLYVVEDSCEAPGATINGKKVGTFGDIATFSFFLSHHITTIEGGMLVTNNESISEIAKSLRAFGWTRELKYKEKINAKYPNIDPRFLFINIGFNIRPTEIQGAFGINQIKKLDEFIDIRRKNARYWNEILEKYSDYLVLPKKNLENQVFFGYGLIIKNNAPFSREEFTRFLESNLIETRPIMAGNYVDQPVSKLINWQKHDSLTNSELIMKNGFFIGNHQMIKEREREYVGQIFEKFLKANI